MRSNSSLQLMILALGVFAASGIAAVWFSLSPQGDSVLAESQGPEGSRILDVQRGDPQSSQSPGNTIQTDLSPLIDAGNLAKVWHFDNATKAWKLFDARPAFAPANTPTQLVSGQCYWLSANRNQVANLSGAEYEVFGGWNLISWVGQDTPPPDQFPKSSITADLGPLIDAKNLVKVWHFDNSTKGWHLYDARPLFAGANTLTQMTPGQCYWMFVQRDQTVTLAATEYQFHGGWNLISWAGQPAKPRPTINIEPSSGPSGTPAVITVKGLTPNSSAIFNLQGTSIALTADGSGESSLLRTMSGPAGIAIAVSVSIEGGMSVLNADFAVTVPATAILKDTFQVSIGADAGSGDYSQITAWLDGPFRSGEVPSSRQVLENISPLLQERVANAQDGDNVEVFVNLADSVALPLFPSLPPGVVRTEPAAQPVADDMRKLIDGLTESRRNSVLAFVEQASDLDITPISTFWLINGFTAEVPLELVSELAAQPGVLFVQLNQGEVRPAQIAPGGPNGFAGDELRIVRNLLNTDPYDNLGLNWGYIGVIDSGLLAAHQLAQGDPGRWTGDCVNGGVSCWGSGGAPNGSAAGTPAYDTGDVCFGSTTPGVVLLGRGHGTAATSIIRGSDLLGADLRGITRITTDSWRVFNLVNALTGECRAPTASITRAVQKAITSFDSLIVLSLGAHTGPASAESTLVDNAFDIGTVVIASAGNSACDTDGLGVGAPGVVDGNCRTPTAGIEPDWRTMNSPGNAQKAISAGARDVAGNCPDNAGRGAPAGPICAYSSRGPTELRMWPPRPDMRYKPDILGYTNIEAASIASPTATWAGPGFSGTSAAAPTVAALAMLYHNWMQNAVPGNLSFNCPTRSGPNRGLVPITPNSRRVCPGHVYAYLLNSAQHVTRDEGAGWNGTTGPAANLNIEGAGRPVAPTNGWAGWGEWSVSQGQTANITLNVPIGACNLSATIWWPEDFRRAHSNLDLLITSPPGFPDAISNSRPSVWERQSFPGPIAPGGWQLSFIGADVAVASQPFYFAWSYHTGAGCP